MIERFVGVITLEHKMEISEALTGPVFNNEVDALDHDVKLKALEDSIDDARKKIKSKVIEAAEGRKSSLGVGFTITKGGTASLNYSDDPAWVKLESMKKDREKLLKQAFEMHQKDPESQLVVDSEEIPVVTVKSYSSESVRYKFE